MKNIKNLLMPFFIIALSTLVFLSGCSSRNEPIKIGVVGTMSGMNSDLSVSGRRGIELAVSELNKAGGLNGRNLEIIVKDDQNDPNIARTVDQEFISEKIPFVIGHYTSGMMVSSLNYFKDKELLFLSPTVSADSLSGIDDNFIRLIATTKEQAVVLTDMAYKNNNQKFAVISNSSNQGFNDALYDNFKELLHKHHGEVVWTQTYSSNRELDYTMLAKKLIESEADALLIIADSVDNAEITQQIRKYGCKVQIYSPLWSNTPDLIKKGGTAIEGMLVVGAIDQNNRTQDFMTFKEKYLEKYGDTPSFSSVYSYEATKVLFKAMKMGPDLRYSTIKNNIIKLKDFQGLEGYFQIDQFGDNVRRYMIFRVINGELRKAD